MYSLPYGKSSLTIPDLWDGRAEILSPGPFPDPDPERTVAKALDNPAGGVGLEEVCRPGDAVACVIPDLTRRAAVKDYLPILLEKLSGNGIKNADVTIIVALGIHRPLTDSELSELVGTRIMKDYSVINHDADSEGASVHIGTTDAGIPVRINSRVVNADCVILTGGITYHYFAGYGGGRKALLPGVASRSSCEAHHRLVVTWRQGQLKGDLAPGVLEGNPVHAQMIQACGFMKRVFTLNVITEPGGGIIEASAGELGSAHEDACRKYDIWFKRLRQGPSELVIAGAGGDPRDVNFVQAHKGLFAAHKAVTRNGVVILAAQCREGTGHPDFLTWFERCREEAVWMDELQAQYQINGQTAFSTWLRSTSVPTVLISQLQRSDVQKMCMIPAGDMEEALSEAGRLLGGLPVPLIIPDAGDVLPVIKESVG